MSKNTEQRLEKLHVWQDRVERGDAAFESERVKMNHRDELYHGKAPLKQIVEDDKVLESSVVWNIVYELMEAQVDSQIPSPKVTPLHKEDEGLAVLIEDFLRNKLDEQPAEVINDQMERAVPCQGGGLFHLEWDPKQVRSQREGLSVLSFIHPKQLTPQPGITSDIEDMDWCCVSLGVTKSKIKRLFGIDLQDEREEKSSLRGPSDVTQSEDMLTWRIIYFRNENGGIGKFSYVNDTVIEDHEDFLARKGKKCSKCGNLKPADIDEVHSMSLPTLDGRYPGGGQWEEKDGIWISDDAEEVPDRQSDDVCPWCGGKFVDSDLDYEEVWNRTEIKDMDGNVILTIPGADYPPEAYSEEIGEGERKTYERVPTKIPFYKPDIYPLILMKNVSSWGHLLGESDIDKIEPQQNAINRLNHKVAAALLSGGSYLTLPNNPAIKAGPEEVKIVRVKSPKDMQYIGVHNIQPSVSQSIEYMSYLYEQARDTIGITDSFQGKQDTTAQSGRAKEVSVLQAAGRFQSKRVMKKFFWSRLCEALFKFELAFADDERPVVGLDDNGLHRDETWNKWLFLRYDEAKGEYYWNTDFNFSIDTESALALDRPTMWREIRSYYEGGALGNPQETDTQIRFWHMMERLHYPNAADIKKQLIEKKNSESDLQAQSAIMQLEALRKADAEADSIDMGGAMP